MKEFVPEKSTIKPIFGKMTTADFYPKDAKGKYIEITITAPFDTKVWPGEVVLLDKDEYLKLKKEVENNE